MQSALSKSAREVEKMAAKLISVSEAARMSDLSNSYIIQLLQRKVIKGEMVGKQWVIDKASFDEWLAKRRKEKSEEA
jgi:excisionase family DNA binding protein